MANFQVGSQVRVTLRGKDRGKGKIIKLMRDGETYRVQMYEPGRDGETVFFNVLESNMEGARGRAPGPSAEKAEKPAAKPVKKAAKPEPAPRRRAAPMQEVDESEYQDEDGEEGDEYQDEDGEYQEEGEEEGDEYQEEGEEEGEYEPEPPPRRRVAAPAKPAAKPVRRAPAPEPETRRPVGRPRKAEQEVIPPRKPATSVAVRNTGSPYLPEGMTPKRFMKIIAKMDQHMDLLDDLAALMKRRNRE